MQVAQRLGLTGSLKLALDAADAASYSSGQKWLDLSGGGYDFLLGTTSGADATDPTFNGTAGRLSSAEYFSTDGGDVLTYDAANESWMNNIHKDNAKFTVAFWYYYAIGAVAKAIIGTDAGVTSNVGFDIFFTAAANSIRFRAHQGGGVSPALDFNPGSPVVLNVGAWNFCAISVDETNATDGAKAVVNGNIDTAAGTYTSPSAAGATHTLQIMAEGNNTLPLGSGDRVAMLWAWEGKALSFGELMALREATRGRFNL